MEESTTGASAPLASAARRSLDDLERPDGDEIDRLAEPLDLRPESVGALTDDPASATPTFSDVGDYLHVTVRAPTDDDELRRVDCLHFAVPSYGGMTKYPVGGPKFVEEARRWSQVCTSGLVARSRSQQWSTTSATQSSKTRSSASNGERTAPGMAYEHLGRLPGLKFMRTLWVSTVAGGPQEYAARNRAILHSAWKWRIGTEDVSAEFDEVAG